jgi:ATP-dependent Clp protease, protease subunit
MKHNQRPVFRASVRDEGTLELLIYGDIVADRMITMLESWGCATEGLVSAGRVEKALKAAGEYSQILVRINSPGGNVFEATAIHTLLISQDKPVITLVDGVAASSASVVMMAGGVRKVGPAALVMIHNSWVDCEGNAAELRQLADRLDKVDGVIAKTYADRTGKTADDFLALMQTETWFSAEDCLAQGLATEILQLPDGQVTQAMAMARSFRALGSMKRLPEELKAKASDDDELQCQCDCDACQAGDCPSCSNVECSDANCTDCPMQSESALAQSNLSLYEARFAALRLGIR